MRVVLVSNDLMVVSRVQGPAARVGADVRSAGAADVLTHVPIDLVIVDLATPRLELEALVAELKSAGDTAPRIVAFGPHVHEDRLAAAREAGCDVVMSRGQFFAQVDAIIGASM
jgi:AmiR/NasT family two-component response regulator